MAKKSKKIENVNMFYMKNGQASKPIKSTNVAIDKNKMKERQRRIEQNKRQKEKKFDEETEELIKMTNKNKMKKDKEQKRKIQQKELKRKSRNKKRRHKRGATRSTTNRRRNKI